MHPTVCVFTCGHDLRILSMYTEPLGSQVLRTHPLCSILPRIVLSARRARCPGGGWALGVPSFQGDNAPSLALHMACHNPNGLSAMSGDRHMPALYTNQLQLRVPAVQRSYDLVADTADFSRWGRRVKKDRGIARKRMTLCPLPLAVMMQPKRALKPPALHGLRGGADGAIPTALSSGQPGTS
jgi:hypothetical protein